MSNYSVCWEESGAVWDEFVHSSPHGSVFVTTGFLNSLGVDYQLITCSKGDRVIAGVVIAFSANGVPAQQPYPFTMYQGIMLADPSQDQVHSSIRRELDVMNFFIEKLTNKFSHLSFSQHWKFSDMRPFQWFNYHDPIGNKFRLELGYTAVIDVSTFIDFPAYLSTIRSGRRQEFKKANDILETSMDPDFKALDELHGATFARQGFARSAIDSDLMLRIVESAIIGGYGKMMLVSRNGIPISSCVFLYFRDSAYYLVGATDPEFRSSGAGTFCLLSMIRDAMESGYAMVDVVGVNSPNRGDFKTSFNASLHPYFNVNLGNAPI